MATKLQATISLAGFSDYLEKLEKMGADIADITEDIVNSTASKITNELQSTIDTHKRSGDTMQALIQDPRAEWKADYCHAVVGFELSRNLNDMKKGDGGWAAVMLEYGTPKQTPLRFVARAVRKTKVKKEMQDKLDMIMRMYEL